MISTVFMKVPVEQTWVAESYEPLFLRQDKQEMDYVVVNEDVLLAQYPNVKSLRKNLIGTIGLTNHRYGTRKNHLDHAKISIKI